MRGRSLLTRIAPALLTALFAVGLLAVGALAHGPTVQLAYGRINPEKLVIRVGDTVHFHNANSSPGPITLSAQSFEAPVLSKGKGWHYTFETAGEFAYSIQEFSSSKGVIVVVPE